MPLPPPGQLLAGSCWQASAGGVPRAGHPPARPLCSSPGPQRLEKSVLAHLPVRPWGSRVLQQLTPAGLCSLTDLDALSPRPRCGQDSP